MCDEVKYEALGRNQKEPLDYMNLVRTYRYFLEQLQVSASYSQTQFDTLDEFVDKEKVSRGLITGVHEYIMRRLHRSILARQKPSKKDIRLH